MERLPLDQPHAEASKFVPGATVTLAGMVQGVRRMAWGGFLLLRTDRNLIQIVLDGSESALQVGRLRPEQTIRVDGTVEEARITDAAVHPADVEVHARRIAIVSEPSDTDFPVDITKKELTAGQSTIFDYRPLTLRHPKQRALFRVQAAVYNGFGAFLSANGFTRIASPKLVRTGAEGGANIFSLDYFGEQAYLAQSPQFYKQMMVAVFGRVYETGPVFRAEKHNTSRHLNEYVSLDLEMRIERGYRELMLLEASLLNAIHAQIEDECSHEIELLGVDVPPQIDTLCVVPFDEAVDLLAAEYDVDLRGEPDLSPDGEQRLCDFALREWDSHFVFVTGYPSAKRPFYTMDDPDHPERTLSFDALFRGVEITTGGQRLHRYEDYVAKMRRLGLSSARFESYLQAFRYGMPPHGGLGFGLERFTARLCGVDNVKALSLFPRDRGRLEP